ncbi:hypothetical protein QZH41_005682 [Actinostola sp. cb2023]|nr:hypothetical protein QZH41_005682 [Actinostola sp. cb2023]
MDITGKDPLPDSHPLAQQEQRLDPYFLTTVVFPSNGTIQDVTRLKLAVFDVSDREKEEMSILGQAVCTIRDIVSATDQKLVLTLTEPGRVLKVLELMGESTLAFKIPIQLLSMKSLAIQNILDSLASLSDKELSQLVQQTLFVMQTHVTGMIQGAKAPEGDEMGMLEDMCVGVQSLTRVKFRIRNCERDDEIPAISGNSEVQEGRNIKVIPVIFTQGVNEHATLAEK